MWNVFVILQSTWSYYIFFTSYLPEEVTKQGSRLLAPGSYLLADTFQLLPMKRNGPFCGEEKRFQGTMTRDEVTLSLSDATEWRTKTEVNWKSMYKNYERVSSLLSQIRTSNLVRRIKINILCYRYELRVKWFNNIIIIYHHKPINIIFIRNTST